VLVQAQALVLVQAALVLVQAALVLVQAALALEAQALVHRRILAVKRRLREKLQKAEAWTLGRAYPLLTCGLLCSC